MTSEDNVERFSNDELLYACIRRAQADDVAREHSRNVKLDGNGDFLAALDAARHRAGNYSDNERSIITRAITRANRSMAYGNTEPPAPQGTP